MIVRLLAVLVFVAVAWTSGGAWAGHEIPFYPSFYAHEIKIEVMEPAAAARLLQKKSLHAYVGADPFAGGVVPSHVAYAESLKSYVVLTFGRSSGTLADAGARCAAAARALKTLSTAKGAFTFHPYPVTPYHDDYLQHFDLVESARSEEHTSELQSRLHLVCRLLLEKKKKRKQQRHTLDDSAQLDPHPS